MRRREFFSVIGSAALLPRLAQAQPARLPLIGFLRSSSASFEFLVNAFRDGLKEQGFVESQNVQIEYRYAENENERLRAMAAALLARPLAVVVADTIAAIEIK